MAKVDRAIWQAERLAASERKHPNRRNWSKAEIAELDSLIGTLTMPELMAHFNRNYSQLSTRLRQSGYRVSAHVKERLGLVAYRAADYIGIPREIIYKDIVSGRLPAEKKDKRDWLVRWPEIKRYAAYHAKLKRQREAVLSRIHEPVMTKQKFMELLNLGETQASRYLYGRIVKAWKIPCRWFATPRHRWEWAVSVASAEKVKRLRESGRLRLNTRIYRANLQAENAKITQRRRDLRAGKRQAIPRRPVLPNHTTVSVLAQRVQLSETVVYEHIKDGRLLAVRVKVGRVTFVNVPNSVIPAYEHWCQRQQKATGPRHPWRRAIEAVHAAGRITLAEAAHQCGLKQTTLMSACSTRQLKYKTLCHLRSVTPADLAAYLKRRKS